MPKSDSSGSQDQEFEQFNEHLDEPRRKSFTSESDNEPYSYYCPKDSGTFGFSGFSQDERVSNYDAKPSHNSYTDSPYSNFKKTSESTIKPKEEYSPPDTAQYTFGNMFQLQKMDSPCDQRSRSNSQSEHSVQSSDEEKLLIAESSSMPRSKKKSKKINTKKTLKDFSTNVIGTQEFGSDSDDDFIPVEEENYNMKNNKRPYEDFDENFQMFSDPPKKRKSDSFHNFGSSADEESPFKDSYSNESLDPTNKSKRKYEFNKKLEVPIKQISPLKKDNKGHSMMERMGYRPGEGLGKHGQGRVDPVEVSKQRGRRGLGLTLPGLDPASLDWDSSLEVVEVKEKVHWLSGSDLGALDYETLSSWKVEGPRDTDIEKMTEFCDANILKQIINGKSVFDKLSADELFKSRSRSNPFETLKNAIFLNRAALKMANMDAAFDFMFTSPTDLKGEPMVGPKELLYFADVCAGPGGFSEYVLWKKKWRAKGIGFTLKGDNDFNLSKFYAGSSATFEPYYGVKNDGNVFDPENIKSLHEFVMDVTDNKGVHFMMADGGFSVEGQENIQELLSKQLYLCQCLVALFIVRNQGHFVCKLFDLFSPFSAGMVYLMYRSFNEISIFKPNTSRPANSERYIVCKHKRDDIDAIRDYMFDINKKLCQLGSSSKKDVTEIVPMDELKRDTNFFDYLTESNNILGERQVVNLMKIKAFCQDLTLREDRQTQMRRDCLLAWKIPNQSRYEERLTPDEMAKNILKSNRDALAVKFKKLEPSNLEAFRSILDWQCFPLASKDQFFYLGLGGSRLFQFNPSRISWEIVSQCDIRLNPGTLVYGEIVFEIIGEGKSQKKFRSLHVIDGVSINYEDISNLPYHERLSMLKLYEKAIEKKATRSNFRVRDPYWMEDVDTIFKRLTVRHSPSNHIQLLIEEENYGYQPVSVLFVNISKEHWSRNFSKTYRQIYFFNEQNRKSLFEKDCPRDAYASIFESLNRALIWVWEDGVGLHHEEEKDGILHKDELIKFVASRQRK